MPSQGRRKVMKPYLDIFERYEKKYLLTEKQYAALLYELRNTVHVDAYGETTILNIYYDTPDHRLIRASLEKPVYKEKLRLRCYGVPGPDSPAFIELKKKYRGIVYKRRTDMTYSQAVQFLASPDATADSQIEKEIRYFAEIHSPLIPAMVIACERTAMAGNTDPELRITFDRNVRWRDEDLNLTHGSEGQPIHGSGTILMEVKIKDALSPEMADLFCDLAIFPVSFSKYGTAYQQMNSAYGQQKVRKYSYDRTLIRNHYEKQRSHGRRLLGSNRQLPCNRTSHRPLLLP